MDTAAAIPQAFPIPAGVFAETVTQVQHYTDSLFRFRITRDPSFRFRSGEFVMIGLPNAENQCSEPILSRRRLGTRGWNFTLSKYLTGR